MSNLHRRGGPTGLLPDHEKPAKSNKIHGRRTKPTKMEKIAYFGVAMLVGMLCLSFLLHRQLPDCPVLPQPSVPTTPLFVADEAGRIFFLKSETEAFYVASCNPCDNEYTLCPQATTDPKYYIPVVSINRLSFAVNTDVLQPESPNYFDCQMHPMVMESDDDAETEENGAGYTFVRRSSLNIEVSASEPKRINIVMTALGRDLTGGPLSIMRFASAMLDKQVEIIGKEDFGFRWINVDGTGIDGEELFEHLKKYDSLTSFRTKVPFIFDALNLGNDPIRVNPDDMFMATLYWTSFVCHETAKHPQLNNKNFLYFIQDFEPIFFPQDTDYLEAMESYRLPHFAIYSTWFLQDWFRELEYGQYQALSQGDVDAIAYASEPAIKPWGKFDTSVFDDPARSRKIIVYARSHADRNAYELTIDTLSRAVCAGLIEAPQWEVIGVGALEDDIEHLGAQCGEDVVMKIYENIPEPEYRKIVRSGDVGLSLMVSPHPSLPPLDFVSAGLVTVTNTFETKTKERLARVSKLFVASEPYPNELLSALKEAIKLSEDIDFRKRESGKMTWESEWDGERCYGKGLLNMVQRWFRMQQPLWDISNLRHILHGRNRIDKS